MVWQYNKTKQKHPDHQRVTEATKYHVETRDPPARIPEITWYKPTRHNNSHKGTPKQTPATPGHSESGEMQNKARRTVKHEPR